MLDKTFARWWIDRVQPFREVPPDKLAAEREAVDRQQEFNSNYDAFLKRAVLPQLEELVSLLAHAGVVHRAASWGNQISLRVHLAWRWGELVISQSHEDCVTFDHSIITEGERRGEDREDNHTHHYDLRDVPPESVAGQELQFFLSRIAQDLWEPEPEPEIPPGEQPA
jgi:hypothetical protein